MLDFVIFYMLSCTSPNPGWYQVAYERVSGDCGALPSHRQHFSEFNKYCSMPVEIKKSFFYYEGEFNGTIKWGVDGKNVRGDGVVTIESGLTGDKCSGRYKLRLEPI